jgi:hypothetical protein
MRRGVQSHYLQYIMRLLRRSFFAPRNDKYLFFSKKELLIQPHRKHGQKSGEPFQWFRIARKNFVF